MIGYVKGVIDEISEEYLLLDRDGVGFRIFAPSSFLGRAGIGEEVKLYTHTAVREDAITLYGFPAREDLNVFRMLLNVSGVGPKAALAVLSTLSVTDLQFAVLSEDAAAISRAPGLGKKTAQKLILELKDKFSLEDAFESKLAETVGSPAPAGEGVSEAKNEAIQALVALGYSRTEAMQAVKKAATDPNMNADAILKAALKFIF